jgi:peptide deformylase
MHAPEGAGCRIFVGGQSICSRFPGACLPLSRKPCLRTGRNDGFSDVVALVSKSICIDRLDTTAYIAAMALREILILPDKRLRKVSEPVKNIDAALRKLVDDMFETMYDAPGIGLAAIQIGASKRVVTMDLAKKEEPKNPQVFINPEIVWSSGEKSTYEEGCLSIPETYEEVERPAQVKVKYLDLEGETHEIEANGLLATCLQHEVDHLNGILFIDHISRLKRDRIIKKFTKVAKRASEPAD